MAVFVQGLVLLNQFRVEEYVASTPLGGHYRVIDQYRNKFLSLFLLPEFTSTKIEPIQELERSSSALRSLKHPHFIQYLGVFQTHEHAFLLEEWVDGPSLREILGEGSMRVEECLIYIKSLCSALDALHAKELVHLNLCPEFIRITGQGTIQLGGIGSTRSLGTAGHRILNKYPGLYLSPEQIRGEACHAASDVYALATLIFQMTTGAWINGKSPPKSEESIRRVHLEKIPLAPATIRDDIPDNFSRMVLWALRKDPEERLKNSTELLTSLSLAARIPVKDIPGNASPAKAPITAKALSNWKSPPLPRTSLIASDAAPLDDRLATLLHSPRERGRVKYPWKLVITLILAVGIIALLWIPTSDLEPTTIPATSTKFEAGAIPSPTKVIPPTPTAEHGGQIAFICTRNEFNQLCIVNRDGTGYTQLTDMDASSYYPVFTPDGEGLLFSSNRNGSFDLYLLVFDQKQLIQLTNRVGNVVSPDYSPDGRRIVFANRPDNLPTSIWRMDSDGSNQRMLYQGPDSIVAVAWSPAGDKIAYAMSAGIPQEYEIFIMDPDGMNHHRLTQGLKGIGGSLDWSPDGKYLLIYAGSINDNDIYRLDSISGELKQITDGGNNAGASYSPDGRFIVFNSTRNAGQADLFIMRADGSNPQQLTNHPEPDWGAHWSP
jgi:serine/threonine protein kinase